VNPAGYRPERGADYPRTAFGKRCNRSRNYRRRMWVSRSPLPTSAAGTRTSIRDRRRVSSRQELDDFSRGLAALVTDLGDRMEDLVVLTMSEFGRAVSENGNRGTDHGHGNAMIAIGGAIQGGRV
jgi:hypothetical protein